MRRWLTSDQVRWLFGPVQTAAYTGLVIALVAFGFALAAFSCALVALNQ